MIAEVEHLLDTLLELPLEDRAAVAAVLTDSLQHGPCDEIEASWVAEVKQRLERVRSGESMLVATEAVEQECDGIVARAFETSRATDVPQPVGRYDR